MEEVMRNFWALQRAGLLPYKRKSRKTRMPRELYLELARLINLHSQCGKVIRRANSHTYLCCYARLVPIWN